METTHTHTRHKSKKLFKDFSWVEINVIQKLLNLYFVHHINSKHLYFVYHFSKINLPFICMFFFLFQIKATMSISAFRKKKLLYVFNVFFGEFNVRWLWDFYFDPFSNLLLTYNLQFSICHYLQKSNSINSNTIY